MKRRDYLRTVSSTALLPVVAEVSKAAEKPQIDTTWWKTSLDDTSQILTITTTEPVDSVELRRYTLNDLPTEPRYKRITDTKHEVIFESPTTLIGMHGIVKYCDEKEVAETLLDLTPDLITRHVEVGSPNTARVAVRNNGTAPVAAQNRAIVTAKQQQPDWDSVEWWNNKRHIPMLEETTSYVQAHVTDDAEEAMRANQAVWVWLRDEHEAWYPATVDFSRWDPVELYTVDGVKRY